VVIYVQGSWEGYAPSDQRLSNVKKFLSVVADMGLPGFSVKDLDEVRVLLSVVIVLKLVRVGFINPGSLGDRLLRQGSVQEYKNNRAKKRSSNRPEG